MTSLIRKLLMLFTVILPITACEQAAQRLTEIPLSDFIGYDHPSADRQKFSKDRYACYQIRSTQTHTRVSGSDFIGAMVRENKNDMRY